MSAAMNSSQKRRSAQPREQNDHDASEQTPLLGGGQLAPDAVTEAASRDNASELAVQKADGGPRPAGDDQPLPKLQLFLLCYARMMEPIAFFSIFPFIAQMVHRVGGLPDSDVGFYSGLIESLFSVVQTVVLIFWGRLADRIGRKPVLVCSLVGMSIGPVLFGLSTAIWQMILFRCMAGAFSGSSLVIRTMISEISTPETQARAFSWFAFAGNVGIFIGPLVGGALADPATQYPKVFKGIPFFEEFPYALAGLVTGLISLTAPIVTAVLLQETLPKDEPGAGNSNGGRVSERSSMWEIVKSPGVGTVLWVYSHVMFLAFAFTALVPVVLYTPIKLGGLGFSPSLISAYMASQGFAQAMWLLVAFPFLQKRLGTKSVMKGCGMAYPFFFAGYIVLNTLLRDGRHGAKVAFWVLGVFIAFIGPGVAMAFTGCQLALNDVSPNPHVLGTLNAIALTLSSAIRSFIPGLSTALYAIGVRNQILSGHLVWAILIPCAAAFYICASMLPDGRKPLLARTRDEEAGEQAVRQSQDPDQRQASPSIWSKVTHGVMTAIGTLFGQ